VLPLLPALALTLAVGLEKTGAASKWWLMASVLTLIALPALVAMVPVALLAGIRKAPIVLTPGIPFLLVAAAVWWLAWREKPNLAILAAGMAIVFAMAYVKGATFPELDQRVSVRGFWRAHQAELANVCVETIRRDWEYGLNYYAGRALPQCESEQSSRIVQEDQHLVLKPSR
jgi:hypothetical protein